MEDRLVEPRSRRVIDRCGMLLVALSLGCGPQASFDGGGPAEPQPQTATAPDGVPILYEVHREARADGPTLIFIHGWSSDRSYWDAQVEPLAALYRVVTLDLAGHGDSGVGRERWTIASYGADVAAVVQELALNDVILVGHSMGGDVAVDAARLLGDRVMAMVWVDTYRRLGTARTPEQIQEFMAPFRDDFVATTYAFVRDDLFRPDGDSALVERVARDMSQAPPEIAIPSVESSLSNDRVVPVVLEEELDLAVVAINPDDGSTDIESMERYGVEVVLMPDVGHFLQMEDPKRFNATLIDVIEEFGE